MGSCLTLDRRGESAGTGVLVRAGSTGELGGVAVTRGRVTIVGVAGGARFWGLGSLTLRKIAIQTNLIFNWVTVHIIL